MISEDDLATAKHFSEVLCLAAFSDVYCILDKDHMQGRYKDHMYTGTFDPKDFEVLKLAYILKKEKECV